LRDEVFILTAFTVHNISKFPLNAAPLFATTRLGIASHFGRGRPTSRTLALKFSYRYIDKLEFLAVFLRKSVDLRATFVNILREKRVTNDDRG
jgi:hypothetical protein